MHFSRLIAFVSIALWMAGLARPHSVTAADVPSAPPQIEMLRTPAGQRYGIWKSPSTKPRPTLFIFAGAVEVSLGEAAYCEVGQRLLDQGYLCVSLDLPCHGDDGRPDESHDLAGWRHRLEQGEPLAEQFVTRARDVLDDLVRRGLTDPNRVAVCGTSRGGFMALHWAAADPRVRAAAAFSPVTSLLALREFAGLADTKPARNLALVERADALSQRQVWITIGDRDRRVDTGRAVELAEEIKAYAHARQRADRSQIEVLPSDGHQTPAGAHERAANWLAAAFSDQPSPAADSSAPAKEDKRKRVLIVTGHQHPAHKWEQVTPALLDALKRDSDLIAEVRNDPDVLADNRLADFDAVVMNYCNWERPGLTPQAQTNLQKYLEAGGGLVIIHFANGAFHFSLPGAEQSDWPEWRTKICRRVWDHTAGKSGHDAFGKFRVEITEHEHPITRGLKSFETIDELYFNQQGTEPIEVLATARSKVTNKDEPMAFVYRYGQGRVFQTVLGHAAESVAVPSVAELIARGTKWAAGGVPRSGPVVDVAPDAKAAAPANAELQPIVPGQFGQALNAARHFAVASPRPAYARVPLTVECWARLNNAAGFNILAAQQSKDSAEHWELYTYAGGGELSLYLPGCEPAEIKSDVRVTDGNWHYLAAQFDDQRARLYVDGKLVREATIRRIRQDVRQGPLWIGGYPPQGIGCAGLIDAVRVSNSPRTVNTIPTAPWQTDDQTIGLWQFDALQDNAFADASQLANPAALDAPWAPAAEPLEFKSDDRRLRTVTIDRSPHESFLSLRLDTEGRLFVGGREGLFVYEPAPKGGYGPRQLLYRFPPHSWITDIEIRGNDLYLTTASALYVLPGARIVREGLLPRRLIWGLPLDLHVTMHGLAWGPEGDLYFAAGDPLLNYGDFKRPDHWGHWTLFGPNGEQTPYVGAGGVFRCRPDGTHLQVVARGLRGCDGLAFDRDWNLFTNDNDHESLAASYSPARLLHVTPQADFEWPRGWMPEKSPDRRDLLELVNTSMQRGVPVGQAYCDEPQLPAELRNNLLVARWDNRTVSRYPLVARGASFTADEHALLTGESTARPVGVAVGRGGRIFVALSDMQGNEGSPTYASELAMLVPQDDPASHPFDAYDVTQLSADELLADLTSPSWSRRSAAHLELLIRGSTSLGTAAGRSAELSRHPQLAAHLPYLLATTGDPKSLQQLQHWSQSTNSELRWHSLRALGEFFTDRLPESFFNPYLDDRDPRMQLAALGALFGYAGPPSERIANGPARSADSYLRQTAATLLARRGDAAYLARLCNHSEPLTRLAGVLAAGFRLTVPPATIAPPAELPLRYEHGNATFVIQYADATIDLKQRGRVGSFTIAERWSKLAHTPDEKRLFTLLAERLGDSEAVVARQAAWFLSLLNDAAAEPQIAESRRRIEVGQLLRFEQTPLRQAWTIGPIPLDDQAAIDSLEQGAIDLSAKLAAGEQELVWQKSTTNAEGKFAFAPNAGDERAINYHYVRLQSPRPQRMLIEVTPAESAKLWNNGQMIPTTAPVLLDLQPGSNDLLVRIEGNSQTPPGSLNYRSAEPVEVVLPEPLASGTLAARLKEATGAAGRPLGPEFANVDWPALAAKGDAARGRQLFGADALGCVKCHAIAAEQVVQGGPSLAGARKRFTVAHLVESILTPNQQVAPVFRASTLVTSEGKIYTGLVLSEDAEQVELLQPDATRMHLAKSLIDEREFQATSPMPTGLVKTPDELRDLLAYLLSENPAAP